LLSCPPHFVLNVPVLKRRTLVSASVPLMHSLLILWLVHGFFFVTEDKKLVRESMFLLYNVFEISFYLTA